jgi:hypothetical protein
MQWNPWEQQRETSCWCTVYTRSRKAARTPSDPLLSEPLRDAPNGVFSISPKVVRSVDFGVLRHRILLHAISVIFRITKNLSLRMAEPRR